MHTLWFSVFGFHTNSGTQVRCEKTGWDRGNMVELFNLTNGHFITRHNGTILKQTNYT